MGTVQTTASVNDLDKIAGLGARTDNPLDGDFNLPVTLKTNTDETQSVLDMEHWSGQGVYSPIGIVLHNYTDAVGMQIDQVGSGTCLRLKNAHNISHRPDKPVDFVGTGDAILFGKEIVDAEGNVTGGEDTYRLTYTGEQKFVTPAGTPIYQKHDKPDDNYYAWHYYCQDVSQKFLFNLNEKFKFYHIAGDKNTLYSNINLSIVANGVESMLVTNTITYHFKAYRCYGQLEIKDGIKDKNGSTGTEGQVLTANGDGTCEWKDQIVV